MANAIGLPEIKKAWGVARGISKSQKAKKGKAYKHLRSLIEKLSPQQKETFKDERVIKFAMSDAGKWWAKQADAPARSSGGAGTGRLIGSPQYTLRRVGPPRLVHYRGGRVYLPPRIKAKLLADLNAVGWKGDFPVTSSFRTVAGVDSIWRGPLRKPKFNRFINDRQISSTHKNKLKNLIYSGILKADYEDYITQQAKDKVDGHKHYYSKNERDRNLPEVKWRNRGELNKALEDLLDERGAFTGTAAQKKAYLNDLQEVVRTVRQKFGGFGSKHLEGDKVDIYQNAFFFPGGAEMLQKLQDQRNWYVHSEIFREGQPDESNVFDVDIDGIDGKGSKVDFSRDEDYIDPVSKGLVKAHRDHRKLERDMSSEDYQLIKQQAERLVQPGVVDEGTTEESVEITTPTPTPAPEPPVSESKKSFDQAFREARASGLRQFMWSNKDPNSKLFGKTYPVETRVAGESEEEWNRKFPPMEIEEKEEERIKTKVQPDPQLVPEEIKKEPIDESVFEMKEESKFDTPPAPEMPPEQTPLDVPKPYGVFAKETPEFQEAEKEQLWAGKHGGEVKRYQIGGEAVVEEKEEVDMNWEETDLPPYDFEGGVKKMVSDESKPLSPGELGKEPEEPKSFEEQEMESKNLAELQSYFDDGQTDILWQYTSEELQNLRDKHVGVGSSNRDRLNDLIIKKKKYEEKIGSYAPGEGRQGQIPPGSFQFESKITESKPPVPGRVRGPGEGVDTFLTPTKEDLESQGITQKDWQARQREALGKPPLPAERPEVPEGYKPFPVEELKPAKPPQAEMRRPAPNVMPPKSDQEQKREREEFQKEQERLDLVQQQKITDLENTLRATDPSRYWNNLGTAGKINAGLAMIFGLASPDGRNAGVEAIKKAIDDDIAQQKLEQDVEIAKKKVALEKVTKKIDNMMKFRKDQTLNEKTKLESDKLKAEIQGLDNEGKVAARLATKRALVMAGKIRFDSLSYADKTAILGKKGMDQFSGLYDRYNKSSEKVQIGLALNTLGSVREYARMQDGIGDTAILFRVLKLLDPTSVVREGEFANAQKSGNALVERLKRIYDQTVTAGGPSLTQSQRDRWVRVAMTQAKQVKNEHDMINKRFDKQAKALGLPTVTTTYNLFENDPVARQRYAMFVKIKKANPQFRNKEILNAMKRKGIPLLY